ncbi:unnamed protein product [Ceratitis capitata]|uniref:(Mediterranean fruit fly) hypothetical protein n=1 Tax=Ceratitis capitata TaxID=7213 RepID=A0A811USI5_CERCA|nr:unnamed protein product [Ceratitis capitata]
MYVCMYICMYVCTNARSTTVIPVVVRLPLTLAFCVACNNQSSSFRVIVIIAIKQKAQEKKKTLCFATMAGSNVCLSLAVDWHRQLLPVICCQPSSNGHGR